MEKILWDLLDRSAPLLKEMEDLVGMAHPECDNSAIAEELWEISMMIYLMCTPEADYRPNDRARVAYALQNIVEDIENKNPNPTDLEQFYLKRIREHVRHIET